MSAIEIKNLVKYYRYGVRGLGVRALNGISMTVEEGEVFGLLGPNGAGKSTAIKILLGLLKQNSGECKIFGKAVRGSVKKQIGYLPESPYFYKFLTGFELVKFYAKLCGMKNSEANAATAKALELVGLSDAADRQLALYSKGMTQRAGLAQAIVHNPKLVILDEPASGLDPIGAEDMAEIILNLKKDGKTVLLCSHSMSEVERLCGRVAILYRGEIAAEGNLEKMLEIPNRARVEFENVDEDRAEKISEYAKSLGVKTEFAGKAKTSLEEFFRKTVERGGK